MVHLYLINVCCHEKGDINQHFLLLTCQNDVIWKIQIVNILFKLQNYHIVRYYIPVRLYHRYTQSRYYRPGKIKYGKPQRILRYLNNGFINFIIFSSSVAKSVK